MTPPKPKPKPKPPGRPLRADALRNRAKVLEAARAVFATRGTGVSTEEVARAAGVGIGTVFRHFPTKETLLEAVYVAELRGIAAQVEALLSEPDAGVAFFTVFTRVAGHATTKNALSAALAEAGVDVSETTEEIGQELKGVLGALLARAQEAGAVRDDIGLPEVLTLLVGATQAAGRVGADGGVRERALAVVLDGLRSDRTRLGAAEVPVRDGR